MIDKTCLETVYLTPPAILGPVREYFGGQIGLDPATEPDNPTGALYYFTHKINGLTSDWCLRSKPSVFVNPPYGRVLRSWVWKINYESAKGCHIVALLPGQRFEQAYWQDALFTERLTCLVLIRRRVTFLRPDGGRAKGNPYGSMLYVFNGERRRAIAAFGNLGLPLDVKRLVPPAEIVNR